MDTTTLLLVIGSSIVFIGIVIWKIVWIMKKINSQPQTEQEQDF